MRRAIPLVMALVLTACSGPDKGKSDYNGSATGAADTAAAQPSYYEAEIAPMLQTNCATCHLTGQEAGNMSLIPAKAITSLVNVKSSEAPALIRVVPGDPDKSYLIMKLEGTQDQHGGVGARMPFGAPPLSPDKIAKIRKWISEGAKP